MKLIVVRHGRTLYNEAGVIGGHTQTFLSESGKKDNDALAERLKDFGITAVHTSDRIRAIDSARQICKYHPKVRMTSRPLLRERNYGAHEGKPKPSHWDMIGRSEWEAPGGETWDEVAGRVRMLIEELKKNHMKETVLVVAHNGFLCIMISLLLEKNYKKGLDEGLQNSSPVFIEVCEKSASIVNSF